MCVGDGWDNLVYTRNKQLKIWVLLEGHCESEGQNYLKDRCDGKTPCLWHFWAAIISMFATA